MGDVGEGLEVDDPGIGGGAGQDHLGVVLLGQIPHLVVVDIALLIHAVGHHVVVLAGEVDRRAVGQVAAVVQAHAHDGVAVLAEGLIDGEVGLGAGVGLHVGVARAEELLGPLDGDVLHHVHALAAAVVALAGVAFGVFVGEHGAGGGQHGGADDVLRGDQLNVLLLPVVLSAHGLAHLGIGGGEKVHKFVDHGKHSFSVHLRQSLAADIHSGIIIPDARKKTMRKKQKVPVARFDKLWYNKNDMPKERMKP